MLIPLAAVAWHAAELGPAAIWRVVSSPDTRAALQLSLVISLVVAAINAVVGTMIAWVLVRDSFPGKSSSTRSSTCPSRCRPSSPG